MHHLVTSESQFQSSPCMAFVATYDRLLMRCRISTAKVLSIQEFLQHLFILWNQKRYRLFLQVWAENRFVTVCIVLFSIMTTFAIIYFK